ncbi:MAG: TSUP family transporter, partial [Alphaproteobacteria bacterium]
NHTVDFVLALLLLLGSVVGAQIGIRIGRRLKADQLKILMAVLVLGVMVKMLLGLLLRPDFLVTYKGGH